MQEYGARLVLDVDPARRTIFAHDSLGRRAFDQTMTFTHEAAPGLSFQVADIFARADRKRAGKTPP